MTRPNEQAQPVRPIVAQPPPSSIVIREGAGPRPWNAEGRPLPAGGAAR